jgi:uncharacterized delta-60 repeat protein
MLQNLWRGLVVPSVVGLMAMCAAASAADGDVDPGFGVNGTSVVASDGTDTVSIVPMHAIVLPDGKLLFSGARHHPLPENPPFEPQIRGMLMRMNADGSADASYGNSPIAGLEVLPDLVPGTRIQSLDSMVRLDDGSVVAAGTAVADAPSQGFIVKLDTSGTPVPGFGSKGAVLLPDVSLHAVAVDSQGRIVACGERLLDFHHTSVVVRVGADGTLDKTFGDDGVLSIVWSDAGKEGYLSDLAISPDDGIVVGGRFAVYGPGVKSDYAIAQLAVDGTFDPALNGTGWRVFHDEAGTSMTNGIDRLALLSDGRVVFAGYHAVGDQGFRGAALGRLAADGATDTMFGSAVTPGFLYMDVVGGARALDASALAIQADGKPVVTITYFSSTERQQFLAMRATADGQLDAGFASGGILEADLVPGGGTSSYSDARAMALQADGRIVIGGRIVRSVDPPLTDMAVLRILGTDAAGDQIFADGFDG